MVLDVQATDASGNRRPLPMRLVSGLSWELLANGGYGRAEVELADDFDGTAAVVAAGDRLEVLADGVVRYRGYVASPSQQLDIEERKTITAYGLMERLNTVRVDRIFVYPSAVDISVVVSDVVSGCITPRIAGLSTDIQTVGYTVAKADLTGAMARDALDRLVSLTGGRAVWGFDDLNTANRIYLRPKGTATKYRFPIGERVKSYSYPPDSSRIVNTVRITGGDADYPNLIDNSSFEQPKLADANDGNLLVNGTFEGSTDGNWTTNGCDIQQSNETYMARSGSRMVLMGDSGDYILQTDRVFTGGKSYVLDYWQKGTAGSGTWYAEVTPDVGGVIRLPGTGSLTSVGGYQRITHQFAAPAGASRCSVKIICNSPSGAQPFTLDDVALYRTDDVVQTGWQALADPGVTGQPLDWCYTADRKHGQMCARLRATVPTGAHFWLLQTGAAGLNVKSPKAYQFCIWVRSISGTATCTPVMWVTKQNGNGRWVSAPGGAVSVGTSWTQVSWGSAGWGPEADDSAIRVGLRFDAQTFDVLVDAAYCGEWNYADPTPSLFVPAKNFEFCCSTDDAFVQADSATPAVVKGSVGTYGVREADESVEGLKTLADAQRWALGYFGVHAQPVASHSLELADCEEDVRPDGLVQVMGSGIDTAFPVSVRYRMESDGMLNASIDLSTERPSFEGLLQTVANAAKAGADLARL